VQELRQQYPIASLLKLAQLPRSTFYYQQGLLQQEDKYGKLKDDQSCLRTPQGALWLPTRHRRGSPVGQSSQP
jgi:hypothetical protein